jgi:hypothetical protein
MEVSAFRRSIRFCLTRQGKRRLKDVVNLGGRAMSDEQTRLLQQILETSREQLAFAKQQHEQFLKLQNEAVAGQRSGLRMSRFVFAFMFFSIALLVLLALLNRENPEEPPKKPAAEQRSPE